MLVLSSVVRILPVGLPWFRIIHCTNTKLKKQLTAYIDEIKRLNGSCTSDPMEFWNDRRKQYSTFIGLAEDLLSAPASQAFVERVFSVCGLFTSGRRNRMNRSLEMRAMLKLNLKFLQENGFWVTTDNWQYYCLWLVKMWTVHKTETKMIFGY